MISGEGNTDRYSFTDKIIKHWLFSYRKENKYDGGIVNIGLKY